MTQRLRELIRQVRECKTTAEEREVISKEAALIRTALTKGSEHRPRNIAKILYMSMLGYPTHWGQMECVKSIASQTFTDKRIGYLGLNILLDENQEVLMLATHSMKTDLLHMNQFFAGLALTTLGNIASEQICRDCAPEIEQLLSSPNPYIQKKAALCAVKIVRKTPDLADQFKLKIKDLLQEKDHAVLIGTMSLMIELCKIDETYKTFFRQKMLVPLIKLLKSLATAGYAPEYDISNITDPFLQVRILNLLRILGTGDAETSEKMNEVLAQIATNTDSVRNVGNAILYECVNTIMSIECDTELRGMAINTLGKFLSNKDNNIRYVSLFTLCKVVEKDTEAVKRHRNIILECLQDVDVSIRRRALQLLYSIVDASDVRVLVRELLKFLETADLEFRGELTAKLCYLSEKYAPNIRWLVDTVIRILTISGDYVPEEFRSNFINIICREDEACQVYVVHKIHNALLEEINQQALNQVGAWFIGEFGDLLVAKIPEEGGNRPNPGDVVALLIKILNTVTTSTKTKKHLLNALLKLSVRLGPSVEPQIRQIIGSYQTSMNLDLQQRACEYSKFWEWDVSQRNQILARLPQLTQKEPIDRQQNPLPTPIIPPGGSGGIGEDSLIGHLLDPVDQAPSIPGGTAGDLIGLLGPTTPVTTPNPAVPVTSATDNILKLFGTVPAATQIPPPGLMFTMPTAPVTYPLGMGNLFPTPVTQVMPPVVPLVTPPPSFGVLFGTPPPANPDPQPVVNPPPTSGLNDPQFPPLVVYQSGELTVTFYFKKPNPQAQQFTLINAVYANNSMSPILDFVIQAAPPKHAKYLQEALSTKNIPPGGTASQVIKASNNAFGSQLLSIKLRITYTINSQSREIEHVCRDFPSGL
jgi:AP-1 complex subunit gamma-1